MTLYQVQVWSIQRKRWETIYTTSDGTKAGEAYDRLNNNGVSPRIVRL